jgi:hypothetical protein
MAKKPKINKSQAVRDYLTVQPDAMPKDVMAALAKKNIKVSRILISTIKTKLKKASTVKKAAKKPAAVAATPAVVEAPAKANGTITLEQIKKVAQTVKTLGGFQGMTEVLEVIKEAGGVKKFKELAEAMTVPVAAPITDEEIPF